MKLSVIIVNYNVEFFLEQCLNSCLIAAKNIDCEFIVVDNNSVDGSVNMVKKKFPQVVLVENKDNLGFSKANNQAVKTASGEYVLLLNPDTVVEEDTFQKVVAFMDEHPDAGGLGVKMIDGKGRFLPESKRGLPTPAVAFYKMFGLSRLFPRSKRFGKYHLSYLSKDEVHEIEILSGAFMLLRKEALDKVGLLDEAFFMYGEDIDLSYRLILGGYKNYYYPHTRIIHYKGESTKKSSINYVFVFYRAMVIFAEKHFSRKNAKLFGFLINIAIYFMVTVSIMKRFFKRALLPFLDFILLTSGFYGIALLYQYFKELDFPADVLLFAIPLYALIYLISMLYSGGYDKPFKFSAYLRGSLVGLAIILMIYGLLPKDVQFSRVFVIFSGIWTLSSFLLLRLLIHSFGISAYSFNADRSKRFVIVGEKEEADRVSGILKQTREKVVFLGYVHPFKENVEGFLGHINRLREIANVYKIDEIIFCFNDTSARDIITWMSEIDTSRIDFKIAQPESIFIIGSNSVNTSGDLYMLDVNSILKSVNRRNKRTLDVLLALFSLLFFPLIFFLFRKPGKAFVSLVRILAGKMSWVGYCAMDGQNVPKLPGIKQGALNPCMELMKNKEKLSPGIVEKMNLLYAKDYRLGADLAIVAKHFRSLGTEQ